MVKSIKNSEYETKRSHLQPQGKKIILLPIVLLGVVLMISMVSALLETSKPIELIKGQPLTFGDKEIIYNPIWDKYAPIKIDTWLDIPMISKTLAEAYIDTHTESCGIDCSSTIVLKTYEKAPLIDDVRFYTIDREDKILQPIRSYQFYIKTNESEYEVNDYKWTCTPTGKININGTEETSCENKLTGTHIEKTPLWAPYQLGTEVDAGVYEVKLEGQKKSSRNVDWQIKTNGIWTESWAEWGGITNADLGLVLYLPFEDTDFKDKSIYGYNGSNIGTPDVSIVTGKVGNAGNFSGTSKLNLTGSAGSSSKLNIVGNTFSMNFWAYMYTNGMIYDRVSAAWTTGYRTSCEIFEMSADGYKSLTLGEGGCSGNKWTMMTLVYNGTDVSFYKNGTYVNKLAVTDNIGTSSIASIMGNSILSPIPFIGLIDEFGLWNRSLSSSEISDLWNNGNGITIGSGSVVLNSPSQNYISPSNSVDFNCSATVTGGATLTNMSLWHNESGTWERNQSIDLLWNLDNYVYSSYYTVPADSIIQPMETLLSSDGTKMYIESRNGIIYQHTLSSPYNINSSSSTTNNYTATTQEHTATGFFLKPDGTKMYIVGEHREVYEYDLNMAWNVSSATYLRKSLILTETQPQQVFFKSDGTKMYITGYQNKVFEYDLNMAWNVSSAIYSKNFSITQTSAPRSIFISSDGINMYLADYDLKTVFQYNLTIPWDVNSITYLKSMDISSKSTYPTGIFFKSDGTKMYITDRGETGVKFIYQYDMTNSNSNTFSSSFTNGQSVLWTCQACDSDGDCGFASENRTVLIDTSAPTIVINSPTAIMNYGTLGGSETLNYTITDTNFASAWYGYNRLTQLENTSIISTDYVNATLVNDTLIISSTSGERKSIVMDADCKEYTNKIFTLYLDNNVDNLYIYCLNEAEDDEVFLDYFNENITLNQYKYYSGLYLTGAINTTTFILNRTTDNELILFANDSAGNVNSLNRAWDYRVFENNITYVTPTTSGITNLFTINLTYDSSYSGIAVFLNYNNTDYTLSSSDTGTTKTYSFPLFAPAVTSQVNNTFYFKVALSNSSGTFYINSSSYNQTVNPFLIDNCTTNSNVLLNMTMFDEESLAGINGTIEALVNIYAYGTNILISTYNNTFNYVTPTAARICTNATGTYRMDYTLKHYGNLTIYFQKYRSIQNFTITNSSFTQEVKLYNLLIASAYSFRITLTGSNLENMLVSIYKQYIAENTFRLVESPVAGSQQEVIAHLVPQSAIYNFVVSYMGRTIGTFNTYQVTCQNPSIGQCTIILPLGEEFEPTPNFNNPLNVSLTNLLNNTGHVLYTTFASTNGESHTVRQLVLKNDGFGNTTICNNSASGTTGTIVCNIPIQYQNKSFFLQTFVDGRLSGSGLFTQGEDPNWYGADIIIELFMYSSLVLLMTTHPILIVIGAMLGIVFSISLVWISAGSFSSIVASLFFFVAAGIIIIWQISKKI